MDLSLGHAEVLQVALETSQAHLGRVGQGPPLHGQRIGLSKGGLGRRGGIGLGRGLLVDATGLCFLAIDQLGVHGGANVGGQHSHQLWLLGRPRRRAHRVEKRGYRAEEMP